MNKTKRLNPWISIWWNPKATIQQQLGNFNNSEVILLFALAGIVCFFYQIKYLDVAETLGIGALLILIVVLGSLFGFVLFHFISFLIYFTGRILNGNAEYISIKSAIGWSLVPLIYLLVIFIIKILMFGNEIFIFDPYILESNNATSTILLVFKIIEIMVLIYVGGIFISGLSLIQDFSIRRSVFNIIFAAIIFTFLSLMATNIIQFFTHA